MGSFGKWLNHEGEVLSNGISDLTKEMELVKYYLGWVLLASPQSSLYESSGGFLFIFLNGF